MFNDISLICKCTPSSFLNYGIEYLMHSYSMYIIYNYVHCIDKYVVSFHLKHFSHILCIVASAGIGEIINCIKEEINKKFPALQILF